MRNDLRGRNCPFLNNVIKIICYFSCILFCYNIFTAVNSAYLRKHWTHQKQTSLLHQHWEPISGFIAAFEWIIWNKCLMCECVLGYILMWTMFLFPEVVNLRWFLSALSSICNKSLNLKCCSAKWTCGQKTHKRCSKVKEFSLLQSQHVDDIPKKAEGQK